MNSKLKFGKSTIERKIFIYNFLPDTELDDIVEHLSSSKLKKKQSRLTQTTATYEDYVQTKVMETNKIYLGILFY